VRTLLNLVRIRRMEFFIVELTIFLIPVLATVQGLQSLRNPVLLEAFLLFFVLYALGDGINCLADRDLDATYKTHLSRAVYELGIPLVTVLTIVEAVVALGLGIHLAWLTGKWLLLGLVVIGMFLGIGYSIPPLHFKSRGLWHLACLWLLLFFVPMLYAGLVVSNGLGWEVLALATSYATAEMGVILINTAEDFPEDQEAGIRTTVVALGLPGGIGLAAWMVGLGSLSFLGTFAALFARRNVPLSGWLMLGLLALVCGWIFRTIWLLRRRVRSQDLWSGIGAVKANGKRVPVWATAIGWGGVLCALTLAHNG
jgi:4-hydroxybenzoate polyprenyltransferase